MLLQMPVLRLFERQREREFARQTLRSISAEENKQALLEAWARGATGCMQGGIHPSYTGQTYLDILATVKQATRHAYPCFRRLKFSRALRLLVSLTEFLTRNSRPPDPIRAAQHAEILLARSSRAPMPPDKLSSTNGSKSWNEPTSRFQTTATIMFGHIERRSTVRDLMRHSRAAAQNGRLYRIRSAPFAFLGKRCIKKAMLDAVLSRRRRC